MTVCRWLRVSLVIIALWVAPSVHAENKFVGLSACADELDGVSEFGDTEHVAGLGETKPMVDPEPAESAPPEKPAEAELEIPVTSGDPSGDPKPEDLARGGPDELTHELARTTAVSPPPAALVGTPEPTGDVKPAGDKEDTAATGDGDTSTPATTTSTSTNDDTRPVEVPQDRVDRAQLGLHNENVLLFGKESARPLGQVDFVATLRTPRLQFLTHGDGVKVPSSVREEKERIYQDFRAEVYRLNAEIQIGLAELNTDYKPASDAKLVQAFVMMDAQKSWTGPTRDLLRKLTEIHELSSESYVQVQNNELNLGAAQSHLATWLQRLLFRLVAGNALKPEEESEFPAMKVYTERLEKKKKESLPELVERGLVNARLLDLYQSGDHALLTAIRELHARIILPFKTPLSVQTRIILKAFAEALGEVEDEVLRTHAAAEGGEPTDMGVRVFPLDPRALEGTAAEADEAQFEVQTQSGRRVIDGKAYRERLKIGFYAVLKDVCKNDRMRGEIHRYAEALGIAMRRIRQSEKRLVDEKARYSENDRAAQIAQHAVAMVSLPRRARGLLLPDSIVVDGYIKELPPNLKEMGYMIIDQRGGYEDPFTNEWVPLAGRTARQALGLIQNKEEREQIIACQFFSRTHMNEARRNAGIFYLRALRNSIRDQIRERKGVKFWSAIEKKAIAMQGVAVGGAVDAVTNYLGQDTPLGQLVEAADLKKKEEGIEPQVPPTEKICKEECELPPPEVLARNVLDTWSVAVLGNKPNNAPDRGYSPTVVRDSFIAGLGLQTFDKNILDRSNRLITSIFERLDEISWKIYEANIEARKARNLARATATTAEEFANAQKTYDEAIEKNYHIAMQQVQTYFAKLHRSVRRAFIEDIARRKAKKSEESGGDAEADGDGDEAKPADESEADDATKVTADDIARAKLEADVTLLHMMGPYEALIWCVLQGESNTNQRFLNDLARHILRQSQNWNGQNSIEPERGRPPRSRRAIMTNVALITATVALSVAINIGINRFTGDDKPANGGDESGQVDTQKPGDDAKDEKPADENGGGDEN